MGRADSVEIARRREGDTDPGRALIAVGVREPDGTCGCRGAPVLGHGPGAASEDVAVLLALSSDRPGMPADEPGVRPFEDDAPRYDRWFDGHPLDFRAEVEALRPLLPAGRCLEVGVGTGRFAEALGVREGVEPSPRMAERARGRGVDVQIGVAEALPFPDAGFDAVLMVTTVCFVADLPRALAETRRVLRPGGTLVVGFIDRDSHLGRRLDARRATNPFYASATFRSTAELLAALQAAGFTVGTIRQALVADPDPTNQVEPALPGHGQGGFVVVAATR